MNPIQKREKLEEKVTREAGKVGRNPREIPISSLANREKKKMQRTAKIEVEDSSRETIERGGSHMQPKSQIA